jgi:hypothetical protein
MHYKKRIILILAIVLIAVGSLKTLGEWYLHEGTRLSKSLEFEKSQRSFNLARNLWPLVMLSYDYQYHVFTNQYYLDNPHDYSRFVEGLAREKLDPAVTLVLTDSATRENVEPLMNNIKKIPGVKAVRFVTREEAFEIYQANSKDDPLLAELMSADDLPLSIEVFTNSIPKVELQNIIARNAETNEFVLEVSKNNYPYHDEISNIKRR